MAVQLTAPLVEVTRDGEPEPFTVQTDNRDLVLWDKTRGRHKWPSFQDAPFIWLTFISWAAAKRQGLTDCTYEVWESTVSNVGQVTPPEGDQTGIPTEPGHEPG